MSSKQCLAEPQSVSTEPSVPHAEASQSVLEFWYCSCPTIQLNVDLNIELTNLRLEVKQVQGNTPKFYHGGSQDTNIITFALTPSCSHIIFGSEIMQHTHTNQMTN